MKSGDEYKTGFVTLHGQYAYLRMGQGLIGAPHTYSQFSDMVFGHLPKTQESPVQARLIGSAAVVRPQSSGYFHLFLLIY